MKLQAVTLEGQTIEFEFEDAANMYPADDVFYVDGVP